MCRQLWHQSMITSTHDSNNDKHKRILVWTLPCYFFLWQPKVACSIHDFCMLWYTRQAFVVPVKKQGNILGVSTTVSPHFVFLDDDRDTQRLLKWSANSLNHNNCPPWSVMNEFPIIVFNQDYNNEIDQLFSVMTNFSYRIVWFFTEWWCGSVLDEFRPASIHKHELLSLLSLNSALILLPFFPFLRQRKNAC